jgi:hypothetical protein
VPSTKASRFAIGGCMLNSPISTMEKAGVVMPATVGVVP